TVSRTWALESHYGYVDRQNGQPTGTAVGSEHTELAADQPRAGPGAVADWVLRPASERAARRVFARCGGSMDRVDTALGAPRAAAAALAFNSALASKVSPVSSGSGRPSDPADTVSIPNGARSAAISSTLPGLWLAMTRRSPGNPCGIGSDKTKRRALAPGELG